MRTKNYKCKICGKTYKSKKSLSLHVVNFHEIKSYEYKKMFDLLPRCDKCGKELSKNNKYGYCAKCRDKSGENNPFYGKQHSEEVIEKLRESSRISTHEKWKDPNFRNNIINKISKPRPEYFKKEQSERIKKWFDDNPEQREIRSNYMKQYWKEGRMNIGEHQKGNLEYEIYEYLSQFDPKIEQSPLINIHRNKRYFPDIVSFENNLIIEFFGDYWHCNPNRFNYNDYLNGKIKASEVWERDRIRVKDLESLGYKVIIVWEEDYLNNKQKVLNYLKSLVLSSK